MNELILIIEDDKDIADVFIDELEFNSFRCIWAHTGSKGLEMFSQNQVDLILLDLSLPDINGLDVLSKIRKLSHIPIIVSTTNSTSTAEISSLDQGANDYVNKSDGVQILIAHIRSALRCNSDQSFSVDSGLNKVELQGVNLRLTPTEFKILSYLIERPNTIISKEEIISYLNIPSSNEVITSHISHIKRKIKNICDDCDYIKTHRPSGYSLNV
jgi:DNA-binding response OmpR family regulator